MVNMLGQQSVPGSFKTDTLHVRRYTLNDETLLLAAAQESTSEVYPFLPWCHPAYSRSDSREWLQTIKPEWDKGRAYSFAIFNHTKQFLGGCGLSRMDEHPVMNLGYWIRTGATRRGVATEATRGLACFAFDHLGMTRVEIIMSTRNIPSQRVAEKAGARFEGLLRNRLYLHGESHDAFLYSLIPDDFGR